MVVSVSVSVVRPLSGYLYPGDDFDDQVYGEEEEDAWAAASFDDDGGVGVHVQRRTRRFSRPKLERFPIVWKPLKQTPRT